LTRYRAQTGRAFARNAAWLCGAGALAALPAVTGCATPPNGRLTVKDVTITGAKQVDSGDLLEHLATQANSTMLGFVLQYEVYDRFVVERDVQRVERFYQARGFHGARVQASRVTRDDLGRVRVEIEVTEGLPTKVALVRLERLGPTSADAGYAVAKAQSMQVGERFDEDSYTAMKKGVLRALTEHGHAYAELRGGFVERDLAPDGGNAIALDTTEGPQRMAEQAAREAAKKAAQAGSEDEEDQASPAPADGGEAGQPAQAGGAPEQAGQEGSPGQRGRAPAEPRRFGVKVDVINHTADVYLQIDPGPECVFGEVKIEGLKPLPEDQVRRALGIRRGRKYSSEKLDSARHALLELGLFSKVDYAVALPKDRTTEIPVTFTVQVAPLHTVTLGGGLRADVLQTDTHFLAGYEHLNFLGGLRRLTMQAQPGMVLFPTNLQNLLPPERVFPQARARAELRQPAFLEPRTRGTLRSEILQYPFITPIRNKSEVPDVVVGYREFREAAGLDRTFFRGRLALSAFYNLQISFPFSYLGPIDQGISRVLISYISLTQTIDFRDNPIKPRLGAYFSNDVQLAGGVFRGDAADVKVQPDARFYVPVSKHITLASRASVGFLFPRSYADTLNRESPDAITDPVGAREFETARNRDLQLLFFRALFSGGPNSNRGYSLRGVGPRGIAPFRIGGSSGLRNCVGRASGGGGVPGAASQVAMIPEVDPQVCSVPLGGLSLWEASLEFRFQLTEALSTLVFLDGSDVTREQLSLRFDFPHLSTGSGLRYDTPVGPVRLDIGYAIPGLQHIGGTLDPVTEGQPATLLGLPIALNIAVGEAF
jgi:outer membrane protein assembly factor BamA